MNQQIETSYPRKPGSYQALHLGVPSPGMERYMAEEITAEEYCAEIRAEAEAEVAEEMEYWRLHPEELILRKRNESRLPTIGGQVLRFLRIK